MKNVLAVCTYIIYVSKMYMSSTSIIRNAASGGGYKKSSRQEETNTVDMAKNNENVVMALMAGGHGAERFGHQLNSQCRRTRQLTIHQV